MEQVKRVEWLAELKQAEPGIMTKGFSDSSEVFNFIKGRIVTCSTDIYCSVPTQVEILGAVHPALLISVLEKLPDELLTVVVEHKEKGSVLRIKGIRKTVSLRIQPQMHIPDQEELYTKTKCHRIPSNFQECIKTVSGAVGRNENRFVTTCIHITPEYVEACDNFQAYRSYIKSGIPDSLIRQKSIQHITILGELKAGVTEHWIHFVDKQGTQFKCPRYVEDFPNLDDIFSYENVRHSHIEFPKDLTDTATIASLFSQDAERNRIEVSIDGKQLKVRGAGPNGEYRELRTIKTMGKLPAFSFMIDPELLSKIAGTWQSCILTQNKIHVIGEEFQYAAGITRPERRKKAAKARKVRRKA